MDLTFRSAPHIQPSLQSAEHREVARDLETVFLAEMLKNAGLGDTPKAFGGGSGEDQFSSFLATEYAKKISSSGGVGLAQHIFSAISLQKVSDNG